MKFIKKCIDNVTAMWMRATVIGMSATYALTNTAYADGTEAQIKSIVSKGLDFVFNFAGGAIVLAGIFSLIMAIYRFINATQARDGEQQREAGAGIGIALMIIALGAGVFVLKTPVSDLISTFFGA